MYGVIYKIVNKINGTLYVGQTTQSLSKRWEDHKYASKIEDYPIYRAIRKYGIGNFYISLLDTAKNQEELDLKEIYYGEYLNTMRPNGYNLRLGQGQGHTSEETKDKISRANKGKLTGNKNPRFGNSHTMETRKKISESRKGKYLGKDNPNFGNKWSKEAKEKASEKRRDKPVPEALISASKKYTDSKKIKVLCLNNNTVYESLNYASRELNVNSGSIYQCLKGTQKTANGYRFTYADKSI